MAPSRVFMDNDVEEARYYLSWLNTHLDVANRVNAEVVTKLETATVGELFSYMKRPSATCIATIDDVVNGFAWYYIGCGVCHTKATKGPTTLMCIKCGKSDIVGVPQYLAKISVYDNNDQAVFVLLGDAGEELTGKKASELVENYYECRNVPVPQALLNTIGETRKFRVKVSSHNFTGKVQSLTVIKVLPLETPVPDTSVGENVDQETSHDKEDPADELVKMSSDGIVSRDGKRAKCG
ncbi:unnamed protein product [Eruca vesicaria subsp. sativa]|uniref:Replication factor A C-terminal domain-containing protein n=1 Tax=Eruca vesicaria subsp. sativa TaxID=29727 RepID=A0ABC8IX12_ERUVS|nr:unnamed protein product [Eruca vesicaria subsp. sativa]